MSKLIPISNTDSVGLGVGRRTLGRRIKNPPPGFPQAIRINGRLFFEEDELEAYKRSLLKSRLSPVDRVVGAVERTVVT
jgi:hypothetical protein